MGSFGPVVALANLGSTLQGTFAAGSRVLDILDEEPVCRDVTGMPRTGFSGAVVRDVSFSYGGEDVIKGGLLEAPEGAIVGVCGKSGSGKSTLFRLFMRFWDVDRGDIEISGRSISRVNTSDLRGLESLVTQETQLFHDTIRNNIRIAKLDATDGEIERACRKASIHEFIASLPHGYDTQVGELGDTLSGGERQRLGLARAFLHDAPFMLLDEPTSNVDSLNEGVILRSLRSARCPLMERKTFCSVCPVHCYGPEMRERIRLVMRYAGPRMSLRHPVMAVRHLVETARQKRMLETAARGAAGPAVGPAVEDEEKGSAS